MASIMLSPDALEGGSDETAEELTIRATFNGTTVMATYVVEGASVLLTSADFGNASAVLDGQTAEIVTARLLREIAELEMARSGVYYMRDDQANFAGT